MVLSFDIRRYEDIDETFFDVIVKDNDKEIVLESRRVI